MIEIKKSYKDEIEPRERGVFYFYTEGEGVSLIYDLLQGG
jgi:hypothetical protein